MTPTDRSDRERAAAYSEEITRGYYDDEADREIVRGGIDAHFLAGLAAGRAERDGMRLRMDKLKHAHEQNDALRAEVERLKRQNEVIRGTLIKTPQELHAVSAAVERMGFGERYTAGARIARRLEAAERVVDIAQRFEHALMDGRYIDESARKHLYQALQAYREASHG